jgi:hypothetical protein
MLSSIAERMVKRLIRPARVANSARRVAKEESRIKTSSNNETNQVMPDVSRYPGLQRLIATRFPRSAVLLGTAADLKTYRAFLDATAIEWSWNADVELPDDVRVVICSMPLSAEHWHAIHELKRRHGARVIGMQELVLPFTPILFAQEKLDYYLKSIDEIAPYYLGESWFGPLDRLNQLLPLSGKRVIEFGPFDGSQTAGLVHHGVRELICIEARAENYIKTLIAKQAFGWDNVQLVMDDMHNADAVKYGRFDLAFCHGTYYHAIAPFVLLENLVSLADNVFVGGFVLKEESPFKIATYEAESYRVQPYIEYEGHFTAGVNRISYYFHPEDLKRFFERRGFRITLMDDEESELASKRFYRFFASR